MKTFYDCRKNLNSKEHPLKGRVLWKRKKYWLLYISNTKNNTNIKRFVVAPRTIYLYNFSYFESFWKALIYLFKRI